MKDLLVEHEKTHGPVALTSKPKPAGEEAAAEPAEPDDAAAPTPAVTEAAVEMRWDHRQAMSMMPASLARKQSSAAQSRREAADVIPGSSVTASSLANAMAPAAEPSVAPQQQQLPARPTQATSFRSINLVPDVDGSDDDASEEEAYTANTSASLLFRGGGAPIVQAKSAPREEENQDAGYLNFLASLN